MKITIIIPVYNEEKTVDLIIKKIVELNLGDFEKEIIVVNDGSEDATQRKIDASKYISQIKFYSHNKNMGKGAAIRTGIQNATGDFILIQDADLEYDPKFIPLLLKHIKTADSVVYGTRLNRLPHLRQEENRVLFLTHYLGNRFLSLLTSLLYGQWLTDMETCYKIFPKKAVLKMTIHAKGFELEPEITAKLLKSGYKIVEVPITTIPRGYDEGKKLHTIRDGLKALMTLIKYRFVS